MLMNAVSYLLWEMSTTSFSEGAEGKAAPASCDCSLYSLQLDRDDILAPITA